MIDFLKQHYGTISIIVIGIVSTITIIRIIIDTNTSSKAMAYIMLVVLFPIAGTIFYFSFGVNYRKRRMFTKKIIKDDNLYQRLEALIAEDSAKTYETNKEHLADNKDLINLLFNDEKSALSLNKVTLLLNGEQKFPEVINCIQRAQSSIHIEYYIFEDDNIGNSVIDALVEKAKQGVEVRFIYDDFGSHNLSNAAIERMKNAGVEIYPFLKVKFYLLANSLNYRNHRKIIIIDGDTAFIGGINVSDKYVNTGNNESLYWRDTHLKIEGAAATALQFHFIANWNFCSGNTLELNRNYFPRALPNAEQYADAVQIVAGGPDYKRSSIMLSFFTAIVTAKKNVYITSPYFIPNESINDALKKAALSGKDVRLLLPGISDSIFVNAAVSSYLSDLLECGVRVFMYQKGFVHAKTIAIDNLVSIVGTANMDTRSFDLNFEINAIVYSSKINSELTEAFLNDLNYAEEIHYQQWLQRPWWRKFIDDIIRLFSPIL